MPVATAYTMWWKASIAISCGAQKMAGGAMSRAGSATCGPGEAGDQPFADAGGGLPGDPHGAASWPGVAALAVAAAAAGAPSRSSRWSPTRSALAIAVSAGFTALLEGKKLVSTT